MAPTKVGGQAPTGSHIRGTGLIVPIFLGIVLFTFAVIRYRVFCLPVCYPKI